MAEGALLDAFNSLTAFVLAVQQSGKLQQKVESKLVAQFATLRSQGMESLLTDWFLDQAQVSIEENMAAAFWKSFASFEDMKRKGGASFRTWIKQKFTFALHAVHEAFQPLRKAAVALAQLEGTRSANANSSASNAAEAALIDRLLLLVHATFFTRTPPFFHELLFRYFDEQFAVFHRLQRQRRGSNASSGSADEKGGSADLNSSLASVRSATSANNAGDEDDDADMRAADSDAGDSKRDQSASGGDSKMDTSSDSPLDSDHKQARSDDGSDWQVFESSCTCLQELRWVATCEQMYSEVLFRRIEARIVSRCSHNFSEPLLEPIVQWVESTVCPWLQTLLCGAAAAAAAAATAEVTGSASSRLSLGGFSSSSPGSPRFFTPAKSPLGRSRTLGAGAGAAAGSGTQQSSAAIALYLQWRARLLFFAFERFGALRIGELFDIVLNFPDSKPAVLNLQECLQRTGQHKELVRSLREAMTRRLLHPGAGTQSILDTYINLIKAMRILDPSGVTLQAVGDPIRKYLRSRPDTLRCIVTSLTSEEESELKNELESAGERPADDSDGEEDKNDDNLEWQPDPIDSDPGLSHHHRKSGDIIGRLIKIYGSKELFVEEYRSLLANKLLAKDDYNTENEMKQIELLKLRFGEHNLHLCDVMLKDVGHSKRVNTHVHERVRKHGMPKTKAEQEAAKADSKQADNKENEEAAPQTPPRQPRGGAQRGGRGGAPARRGGARGGGAAGGGSFAVFDENAAREDAADSKGDSKAAAGGAGGRSKSRGGGGGGGASAMQVDDVPMTPFSPATNSADEEDPRMAAVDAFVISKHFWPESVQTEQFNLPPPVQEALDAFGQLFSEKYYSRQLDWAPSLGSVTVSLDLEDGRPAEFTVSPMQATIINHFVEQPQWTLSALAETMSLEPSVLRTRIHFWLHHKILREVVGKNGREYHVIERLSEEESAVVAGDFDMLSEDAQFASGPAAGAGSSSGGGSAGSDSELVQTLQRTVTHVLSSYSSLHFARLHALSANVYSSAAGTSMTITQDQLQELLNRMVEQKVLRVTAGGEYSLVK